jgi:arylsulfatase A-like enzyme
MVRVELAMYYAVISHLDEQVGRILSALERLGEAERTLVVFASDHGLAIGSHGLRGKQNMYEHTVGVPLIVAGPGVPEGARRDAQVYLRDLYPTACELAGVEVPSWAQGCSLMPLVTGDADSVRNHVFAELTYHAAYEPQRAIRTQRWKYIRRFGERELPVLANVDDGPSKDLLIESGWADRPLPREELHDLLFDPQEAHDLAADPAYAAVREDLRERLETWGEPDY